MKRLFLPILLLALVPSADAMAAGLFGGNNKSITIQRGNGNAAATILNGNNNFTTIVQLGNDHSYIYDYTGDNRGLGVLQKSTRGVDASFSLQSGNSTAGSLIVIELSSAP